MPDKADDSKGEEIHIMFAKLEHQNSFFASRGDESRAMFVELTPDEVMFKRLDPKRSIKFQAYSLKITRKLRWCVPGAVYKVTKTDAGISYTPKSTPVFNITGDRVTAWAIEHRAAEQSMEAFNRLEKTVKARPDRKLLEPFRDAYRVLNGPARAQLIADLVAYITRN